MKQFTPDQFDDIERYMEDGRFTAEPDGIKYDMMAMYKKVKEMGRPLTEEEAKEYRLN